MDRLTQVHLQKLWDHSEAPCVSMYLSTHRSGAAVLEDPIRLKNLMKKAEGELLQLRMRAPDVKELLRPIEQLVADQTFWRFRSGGLAVFRSPVLFRQFRLHEQTGELVVVGDHFHTKPLLRNFVQYGHFHLLAVSRNAVRLLHVTRGHASELTLNGAPRSLGDLHRFEDLSKDFQYRKGGSGKRESPGAAPSHGGEEEDKKDRADLLRFFRLVDRAVQKAVGDPGAPLVWAGVVSLFPLYREASTYPNLVETVIPGNPERRSNEELVQAAWGIIEPVFAQAQATAAARFRELAGTPRASANLQNVLPAAHRGRVEQLFLAHDRERWGRYDAATDAVVFHGERAPGDSDLLDVAASHVFRNGGRVYCVPSGLLPEGNAASGVAAVFRF